MKKIIPVILTIAVLAALVYAIYYNERYVRDYPMDFEDSVNKWAREYGVPRELVYAVINVESGFDPDAVSRADAHGLMQLIRPTCDEMAERLGVDEYSIDDTDTNVRFGTYYLSYLYRYFKDWKSAVAAYNAGMGRVRNWLDDERYSDDGVTLKEIPIDETRRYVALVFEDMEHYAGMIPIEESMQ